MDSLILFVIVFVIWNVIFISYLIHKGLGRLLESGKTQPGNSERNG